MNNFNMLGSSGFEDTGQQDEFLNIRKKFEQTELEKKLKGVFFGGYSRKNVNEIIDTYKDMTRWMQDNFEFQIEEFRGEKERLIKEREMLKKQLEAELEKSKEIVHAEQQLKELEERYEELYGKYETAVKDLDQKSSVDVKRLTDRYEETLEASKRLKADCEKKDSELEQVTKEYKALRREYEKLKEKCGKLMTNRQKEQDNGDNGKKLVCQLTGQLESLSSYCMTLEKQHVDMEKQLASMRMISQGLEKITSEHEQYKKELQECQRKYLEARRENTGLGKEIQSAREMMEEVLEQFTRKEAEAGILKQNLKTCKQQLIEALKAKLEQQTENFEIMEKFYNMEQETKEGRKNQDAIRLELEEMAEKCRQMDEDKIIRLSSAGNRETSEDEIDNRRINEILERAQQLTERLARLTQSMPKENEECCALETTQEETENVEIS